MTVVTTNGHVYSDDGSAARDMRNGGAKIWLLPLVADVMVSVDGVDAAALAAHNDSVDAAASAAAAAASATTLSGTSATSNAIGMGSKSFTTQPSKQFATQFLRIQRQADPAVYFYGRATAYNSTTGALTVDVQRSAGSGTYTDWDIYVTSMAGDIGPSGASSMPQRTITSTDTVVATDSFKLLLLNGTFTLGATAAATLGSSFSFVAKNTSATTLTTFDPAGSETVDGAGTLVLQPGESRWFFCTGSGWITMLIDRGRGGVLHVRSQYASGTAGIALPTNYSTVDLNTIMSNTIAGASASSGIVTLPNGTYRMECAASVAVKSRLMLSTAGGATILDGLSASSMPTLRGEFTIAASSASYPLKVYNASGSASTIGTPIGDGDPEVYVDVFVTKVM